MMKPPDVEWILRMVELEEELGPIVPGGAQGGLGPKLRRQAESTDPDASEDKGEGE